MIMQKYIGNIVVSNLNYKVDKCFNKVKTLDDIDNNLPTLIVGLDNAKSFISDFKILKREYLDNNLWWTLSKTEKRIDYDKNISDFYNFCIKRVLDNIRFTNINIFELNFEKIKKILNYVNNSKYKRYYIDNNKYVFLYDTEKNKYIYGFSLNTASFFGISKKKIIRIIEKNEKNIRISNFYSIPNTIKRIIDNDIPSEMILLEYFI